MKKISIVKYKPVLSEVFLFLWTIKKIISSVWLYLPSQTNNCAVERVNNYYQNNTRKNQETIIPVFFVLFLDVSKCRKFLPHDKKNPFATEQSILNSTFPKHSSCCNKFLFKKKNSLEKVSFIVLLFVVVFINGEERCVIAFLW